MKNLGNNRAAINHTPYITIKKATAKKKHSENGKLKINIIAWLGKARHFLILSIWKQWSVRFPAFRKPIRYTLCLMNFLLVVWMWEKNAMWRRFELEYQFEKRKKCLNAFFLTMNDVLFHYICDVGRNSVTKILISGNVWRRMSEWICIYSI